jgi:hypothetical protein
MIFLWKQKPNATDAYQDRHDKNRQPQVHKLLGTSIRIGVDCQN